MGAHETGSAVTFRERLQHASAPRRPGQDAVHETATAALSRGELVQRALASPAQALDAGTTAFMESRLGHDFARVRIHAGDAAASSAEELAARAFTVGSHIVFARGEYTPGTQPGRAVLAHELTHVVQQAAGPVDGRAVGGVTLSHRSDPFEREAVSVAARLSMPGRLSGVAPLAVPAGWGRSTVPAVQRHPGKEQLKGEHAATDHAEPADQEEHLRWAAPKRQLPPGFGMTATTYGDFIGAQVAIQGEQLSGVGPYTTVGFEHEFCGHSGPLEGISHVTVALSAERMPYTGLPFRLDTDAGNALELVSPPFLFTAIGPRNPAPRPGDVVHVDALAREALIKASESSTTLAQLVHALNTLLGINLVIAASVTLEASHISFKAGGGAGRILARKELESIGVVPMNKHGGTINTQLNFATDARAYSRMIDRSRALEPPPPHVPVFEALEVEILRELLDTPEYTGRFAVGAMRICESLIARTLSAQLGVYFQYKLMRYQAYFANKETVLGPILLQGGCSQEEFGRFLQRFEKKPPTTRPALIQLLKPIGVPAPELRSGKKPASAETVNTWADQVLAVVPAREAFTMAAFMSSRVKDVHGLWPKDAWENVAMGVLEDWIHSVALPSSMTAQRRQWYLYTRVLPDLLYRLSRATFKEAIMRLDGGRLLALLPGKLPVEDLGEIWAGLLVHLEAALDQMVSSLADEITRALLAGGGIDWQRMRFGHRPPPANLPLFAHVPEWVGARQKTYLDPGLVGGPRRDNPMFGRLLVVETRTKTMDAILAILRALTGD